MATKILVVQAQSFSPSMGPWSGAKTVATAGIAAAIKSDPSSQILLAPIQTKKDPVLEAALQNTETPVTCLFFRDHAQADQIGPHLNFLTSEGRTTGVKVCLEKGSSIFSESFFTAAKVGERLDSVFGFARSKLPPQRAVEAWGTLHALLFLAIRFLPEQGEKGSGERVDVQVGADGKCLAFSIRFDLPLEKVSEARNHALLELPRGSMDFFEFRHLRQGNKVEFFCINFLEKAFSGTVEAISFQPNAALENSQEVKDYQFLTFGSLKGTLPEEKRVVKGGFRKKFSDQVKVAASASQADDQITKVAPEKVENPETGNFLVKGEVLQPNSKVVVSGSSAMGKTKEKEAPQGAAQVPEKNQSLLESKIQGLEDTLKQREELITKLNKEIADIKDPLKMGVISGIKDNQLEGLKSNISRLEAELLESQNREKEFMGVVDKAIQMKDEAVKRLKDLEVKLSQSKDGNNSKIIMLEKQLDDQKRQNKELSKKITTLTDQINGKKAA